MNVNLPALIATYHYGQQAERIDMAHWVNGCGTAGCLVVTAIIYGMDDLRLPIEDHLRGMARQEIPELMPIWQIAVLIAGNDRLCDFVFDVHNGRCQNAKNLSGPAAINRLRKTIAYLSRKQQLWDTEPDRMRNQEGDWGFVEEAVEAEVNNG